MSILIKGIDVPKYESLTIKIMPSGAVCDQYGRLDERVKAVEVPTPHGRLVDINTILHDGNRGCVDELINDPELSEQIKVGVSTARVVVCSAPTIIEAEE